MQFSGSRSFRHLVSSVGQLHGQKEGGGGDVPRLPGLLPDPLGGLLPDPDPLGLLPDPAGVLPPRLPPPLGVLPLVPCID